MTRIIFYLNDSTCYHEIIFNKRKNPSLQKLRVLSFLLGNIK